MTTHSRTGESNELPVRRWRRLLQGKLLVQLTLPAVIGLVQLGAAVIQIRTSAVPPAGAGPWLLWSFALGFGLGCAIRVAWDDRAAQVVVVGNQLALTLGFVVFNLGSKTALEYLLGDLPTASASVLLVGSGLLLGHSAGLMHRVHGALARRETAELELR
jgi:hypothetical protein